MTSRKNFQIRTVFAAALTATLTTFAAAQSPGPDRFSTYMDAADDLRDAIDHEQFDYAALALALALEQPEVIAARVDALVATQIYAGALRGAEGTLRAGAGNSLDQALLLQSLLIDAGQEARIARTRLDDAAVARIFAASRPADRRPALADPAAGEAAMRRMEDAAGTPGILDGLRALLAGQLPDVPAPDAVAVETDRIVTALGPAMPDRAEMRATLTEEARDYFWVQTRLFGTQEWRDLHIAFAPDGPLDPQSFVAAPLPEDLTHRLRVAFELEIREADKLRLVPLMDEQRIETLSAPNRPLVLSILPDGVIPGADSLSSAVPDTTFHFPLLNGELAPRGVAFTADGLTASAGDVLQSNGMASVIAAGAGKLSEAGGLLSTLGADETEAETPPNTSLRDVTGLWAVITIDTPGQDRRIIRRPLVDRIGADLRAAGQVFAPVDAPPVETALLGQWMVMIQTGGVGQAEMLAMQIDRLREMTPAMLAGDDRLNGLSVANPAMQGFMTTLFDVAADVGATLRDGWTYRHQPGVLVTSQTYHESDGGLVQRSGIDILTTGRRALGFDGAPLPEAALAAGVAETLAERIMADAIAVNFGQLPAATAGSWDLLTAAGGLLPVARRGDIPDINPAVQAAMQADIDRGHVLAFAGDGPAWWRIDSATGAAIGVDALGGGAESAEYITIMDAIITYNFTVYGTLSCATQTGNLGCCAAANIAWGALGFGIWWQVGKGLEAFTRLGAVGAGWAGLVGGAGASATGWNPFQGPC